MKKLVSIEDIVSKIKSGDLVAFGYVHKGFMPLFEILKHYDWKSEVDFFIPSVLRYASDYIFPLDVAANKFSGRFLITQIAPEYSSLIKGGNIDILPLPISQIPMYLKKQASKRDVWLFAEVSPPDKMGQCNTGYSVPFSPTLYKECTSVALINKKIPHTYGDSSLSVEVFNYFTPMQDVVPFYPEPKFNENMIRVGKNVADLIENGTTIEAGVGEINYSVMRALSGKKDIGFQSGLIPEDIMTLVEEGCISGKVSGNVTGARSVRFYNWIDKNPDVEIKAMNYTHNIVRKSAEPGFTALGAALCVDLLGQVVSETIGHKQITGIGGALDFARACGMGNGKSIIALTSTLEKDNRSKILPIIKNGDVVSLTRHDVDYIVTEYGVAELKYQSRGKRAKNIISVAHPIHREELTKRAKEMSLF